MKLVLLEIQELECHKDNVNITSNEQLLIYYCKIIFQCGTGIPTITTDRARQRRYRPQKNSEKFPLY